MLLKSYNLTLLFAKKVYYESLIADTIELCKSDLVTHDFVLFCVYVCCSFNFNILLK